MALVSAVTTGSLVTPFDIVLKVERGEYQGVVKGNLRRIRRLWRRNVRRRSGRLARHGRIEIASGGMSGRLIIDPPHMDPIWEEEDTRPHTIRAKPGKVLSWVGADGQRRFAREVHHPGTRGSHALRRAVNITRQLLPGDIRRVTQKIRTF